MVALTTYSKNMYIPTAIPNRLVQAAVVALMTVWPPTARAQAGTDIYLSDITWTDGRAQFGPLVNVTNRPGYDNQPSFSPDGRAILYTSIRDGQADAWRYETEGGILAPITDTPESEYSPTVMPGGETFSVIRVEMDSTQRLWQFTSSGQNPAVIYERIMPVGYHAWIDRTTTAMFVLGRPATLHIGDVSTGEAELVASDIGRSIHKVPGRRAASFLHRLSENEAWITIYDPDTRQMQRLIPSVETSQDYAWMPDGSILMGSGSTLHMWRPGSDAWQEAAEFAGQISNITRLAVSPSGDRLAVVGDDP